MNPEDTRTIEQLIAVIERGIKAKYAYFWGHTPKVPGQVDQSCLSNWFPAPFQAEGQNYPTTEHYMMAEKARLFRDEAAREKILTAASPGAAKALGRKVKGFDEATWVRHRFEIMVAGVHAKFSQQAEMRELLLRTGTKVLVEASPVDRIWGIGMAGDDTRAGNPRLWKGLNLLGFALMEARARLARP